MARNGRKFVSSLDTLAGAVGVSVRALRSWKSKYGDAFPSKVRRGWPVDDVVEFAKRNQLGPFYARTPQSGNRGELSLTDERKLLIREQRKKTSVDRQDADIDLRLKEGSIVEIEEALQFYERTTATAVSVIETLPDMVERELPEAAVSESGWSDFCERLIDAAKRVAADARAVIQELMAGEDGDSDSDSDDGT